MQASKRDALKEKEPSKVVTGLFQGLSIKDHSTPLNSNMNKENFPFYETPIKPPRGGNESVIIIEDSKLNFVIVFGSKKKILKVEIGYLQKVIFNAN